MKSTSTIQSVDELSLYYQAARHSSQNKVAGRLSEKMQEWLSHSPFFTLATVGEDGIDCSPRGDLPGTAFKVLDEHTIIIPDRRGNNRLDSLRNIIADSRVGMVFLVPGIDQALRIRGIAEISVDPNLLTQFSLFGELPATVIKVTVQSAFVQNARAVRSAELWQSKNHLSADHLPSAFELSTPQ